MSYQVLARKWRPRTFNDMVGQDAIVRMLSNALEKERLHHAYLFTGTRGVGKTTVARIFAKCLNCEKGISANPCDTCTACQAINAGHFIDLMEIDAASRTKVEDTRELLDNVNYAPTQGRFKIYLIDEVHMLSNHSFNALLKTLEEPPLHVKFLLATTDPKRLPITILSRCLQFNLKAVSVEQIAKQLAHICDAEKIAYDEAALNALAQAADGSLRDALSLLDQAIAFCGTQLSATDTQKMVGLMDHDTIYRLLDALIQQDGKKLYQEIQTLTESAPDYQQLVSELLSTLHHIAVCQTLTDTDAPSTIQQFAKQLSAEDVQLYYQIALIGKRDLTLAPRPAQGFEMLMLRMLAFKPALPNEAPPSNKSTPPVVAKETKPIQPPTPPTQENLQWSTLLTQLQLTGVTNALAANCSLIRFENNKATLALSPKHEALLTKRTADRIEEALSKHFGQPIKLDIKLTPDNIETPAKQHQEKQTAKLSAATNAIKIDQNVQNIIEAFDATLDENSIKAIDTV